MTVTVAPFVAVTKALKKLIEQDVLVSPGDETIQVTFSAPDKDYLTSLTDRPEINLYMYSCQENLERRYGETFPVTASTGDSKTLGRAPRLVDLNYMISAWSRGEQDSALMEQYLLSRVVQGIGKYTMFPTGLLAEEDFDPGISGVMMKMMFDQDSKRNQGEFWSALGVPPKPVLSLELTVPVNVHEAIVEPIIISKEVKLGRKEVPTDQWQGSRVQATVVWGRVTLSNPDDYEYLVVYVRSFANGDRWQVDGDSDGDYRFNDLPAGEYMISAENKRTGEVRSKELILSLDDDNRVIPLELNFTLP